MSEVWREPREYRLEAYATLGRGAHVTMSGLKWHNRDVTFLPNKPQPVAQWSAKRAYMDFKFVTLLCFHAVCKAQRCCAKKVHMEIAGITELRVLEMVMFEVRDCVTHIVFAGQKRLLPDRLSFPEHSANPLNRPRRATDH